MMQKQRFPHDRRHFRLAYPSGESPRLHLADGSIHPIVDCSEGGLRYRPTGTTLPAVGSSVVGEVRFRSGRSVSIAGAVVRIQAREVAVQCLHGAIPFSIVWEEQRRMRERKPIRHLRLL